MTTYAYINETTRVTLDGDTFYVKRYSIATTPFVVYDVYEPTDLSPRQHTTVTHEEHGWLGKVITRTDARIETMTPGSAERLHANKAIREARADLCRRVLLDAYPELADREDVRWDSGSAITTELDD